MPKNKFYDQIAFKVRPNRFETSGKAGVFDYFEYVMKMEDEKLYAKAMGEQYEKDSKGKKRDAKGKTSYYKTYWRTFQLSDHLPMWVEIKIDHTDAYLNGKLIPPQKEDEATAAPSKEAHKKKRESKISLVGLAEHKITGLFSVILAIVHRYHSFHGILDRGSLEYE